MQGEQPDLSGRTSAMSWSPAQRTRLAHTEVPARNYNLPRYVVVMGDNYPPDVRSEEAFGRRVGARLSARQMWEAAFKQGQREGQREGGGKELRGGNRHAQRERPRHVKTEMG